MLYTDWQCSSSLVTLSVILPVTLSVMLPVALPVTLSVVTLPVMPVTLRSPQSFECNYEVDCSDGSDEGDHCVSRHTTNTSDPQHSRGLFNRCLPPAIRSCDNGTLCLMPSDLCDGNSVCYDGSDEGERCGERSVVRVLW